MPSQKTVESLQHHCLYSIIVNLDHHCLVYREMCRRGDRRNTSYKLFQRVYTEEMCQMLRDRDIIPDSVCPSANRTALSFDFPRDRTKPREEDYLAFLFNPYAKTLNLSCECQWSLKAGRLYVLRTFLYTKTVLHTVKFIAKNLSVVSLKGHAVEREDLVLLLQSIPQVQSLNLSYSCCSDDHIDIIRKNCPLLKQLDISSTSVTDEGVKYLFAKNSERCEDMCQISSINIKYTDITMKGMKMILESCLFLEDLRYYDHFHSSFAAVNSFPEYREYFRSVQNTKDYERILYNLPIKHIFGGVLRMLVDRNKPNLIRNDLLNIRKSHLKELLIGYDEADEHVLKFAPICCPEVSSIIIDCAIPPEYILLCTTFSRLKEISLILNDPVWSSEILELFNVHGHQLEGVYIHREYHIISLDYTDVLHWLGFCNKLKEFTLESIILTKTRMELSRNKLSLNCLSASLRKINLCNLSGSGSTEFLRTLLLSATHVSHLTMSFLQASVEERMKEAYAIHGFKHLQRKEISHCDIDQ